MLLELQPTCSINGKCAFGFVEVIVMAKKNAPKAQSPKASKTARAPKKVDAPEVTNNTEVQPEGRYRVEHAGQVRFTNNSDEAMGLVGKLIEETGVPFSEATKVIDTQPEPVVEPVVEVKPEVQPEVVTAPVADKTESDETPNTQAVERINAQHEAINACGLAVGELWFPVGTPLYQSGKDEAKRLLREIEALPKALTALPDLVNKVKSESRRDVIIADVTSVKMDPTGAFILPGEDNPVRPTKRGIQAIQADLGISVVDSLQSAKARFKDPSQAIAGIAAGWNAWADNVQSERGEKDKVPTRLARVRNNEEGKSVLYAFVSDSYANEIHAGDIAQHVMDMLDSLNLDPACGIQYSGDKVQIDLILPTPVDPGEFHVGECWKIQIRVRSDDTGGGSLRVCTGLNFARCRNFSVSVTEHSEMNRRHIGDSAILARELRGAIASAHERVQPLIKAWNASVGDDLIASLPMTSPARSMTLEEAFPGFARSLLATPELVAVLPRKGGATANAIAKAWSLDDGPGGPSSGLITRGGLINAFTRYAHTESDPWAQDAIERVASGYLQADRAIGWLPAKK